jgi:hypothetical protein
MALDDRHILANARSITGISPRNLQISVGPPVRNLPKVHRKTTARELAIPITRRPDGWPQSVSRSVADVSTRHRRAGPFCVAFFNANPVMKGHNAVLIERCRNAPSRGQIKLPVRAPTRRRSWPGDGHQPPGQSSGRHIPRVGRRRPAVWVPNIRPWYLSLPNSKAGNSVAALLSGIDSCLPAYPLHGREPQRSDLQRHFDDQCAVRKCY